MALTNNDVMKKLRVALQLRDDDIVEILSLVDYKISKSWYLNVAPMFKYQFNTYSGNSGNFRPYIIGVYSGFIIKL